MDRVEIKRKARELYKPNMWNIWKPILVLALISGVIGFISTMLFGDSSSINEGLSSLVSILLIPAEFGLTYYLMKLVRGEEYSLEDLKNQYPRFLPLFLISLLTGLFIALWSILFIIPGIIAAISYSMVEYIAVDPKYNHLSEMEVLKKSKELMNGHKWEFVKFELSFIGWILLSIMTCGVLSIWTIPYIEIANIMFYEELIKNDK